VKIKLLPDVIAEVTVVVKKEESQPSSKS